MKTQSMPKPIRGQSFPGYIKVSCTQVERLLSSGQTVTGFMVGNKVNSFHFFGGWCLASRFTHDNVKDFQTSLNAFSFYLEPELGSRAALYIRKPYRLRAFTLWTTRKFLSA